MDILIIDDSADDRELCKRSLKKALGGAPQFMEADSGEHGLQSVADHSPACVLLDYSLPKRNGIEILKQLRERHPFVPVVMMTGQGSEAVAVSAIHEGAQNYIAKSSITPETLERVIRLAIEHCALEKRIYDQRTSLEIFTRALAHDLKEPVRTIGSFVELMERHKNSPEKMEKYFRHVRDAAARMAMLIDTVFLYTQLDAPERLQRERCDMNHVLGEAKDNLGQLIRERGASVTSDPLPDVLAYRAHMLQVLQNLVANAIHHNDKPTAIHVHADERSGNWLFSVRDNGPGIAPEYLDRIFTPFKRLGHTEDGAGLGLSICRKIIELQGGRIWCESSPGDGAVFFFTLPKLADEFAQAEQAVEANPSLSQAENARESQLANVLLVDDRESDIDLTRLMLAGEGGLQCNLLVASSGREALDILQSGVTGGNIVDLMLIDINMPEMDGFELLERMRKDASLQQTAVVMCTGSTYDKDRQRAESLGAVGYLVKPPWFDKLKPILERTQGLRLQQEGQGYMLLRAG